MSITDAIGRFLRIRRAPRGTDFYDLAERESRVPVAEMAVADAILSHGGPLAERALRQLRETPGVRRLRAVDGSYEMRIVTYDNLTIRGVPRAGWMSEPIPVETTDARRLELQIGIVEARNGDTHSIPDRCAYTPPTRREARERSGSHQRGVVADVVTIPQCLWRDRPSGRPA